MIRSFLKSLLNRALGRAKPTPTAPVRPPRPPAPRPARPEARGHDHGHDHGGGGHDHGHDHGGGGHDHGHDHGGGHDHGHDHGGGHDHGHEHGGGSAAPAAVTPAPAPARVVHVWASETPNPHAMKFATNVQVVELGALSFNSAEEAEKHPLGRALWAIQGVAGVFAVRDFVTVTRTPEVPWETLTPQVSAALVNALAAR